MAVPKPNVPSAPKNTGRLRKLIEMKGATNVVGDHKFDIPKVDLVRSMFRGSDETRSELRSLWVSLPAEQKQALYIQMIEQMPSPKGGANLSVEGQEILDFLNTGNIDPVRAQQFNAGVTAPKAKDRSDVPSRTFSDVDSEIDDGAAALPEMADDLPGDDVQAGRAKRPLPKHIDLKGNNLHGSDPRRATSALEDRQNFRVDSHVEMAEVPGPDGAPVSQPLKVIDGSRLTPQDAARMKRAEAGYDPGGLDSATQRYTDPDTGQSKQGQPGRSAADRGEGSKQESYTDAIIRLILGQQGSAIFRPKMGSNDDVMMLYEMLRANPNSSFHADPRAAFGSPADMAEVLYNNMDQGRLLNEFQSVSPTRRKKVLQGLEDENIDNRNLGLPPVSQGQAAQLAGEMGMPTSRSGTRGPIEQQAIDSLTAQIIQRLGGSGWGRKYDEAGNIVEFGTGVPDEPTGLPGVTSQGEMRLPDQSSDQGLADPSKERALYQERLSQYGEDKAKALRGIMKPGYLEPDAPFVTLPEPPKRPAGPPRRNTEQGVWVPDADDPVKEMIDNYRQAQYRHGVQEHVGGLPMDKPGAPESSGAAREFTEKPDNRSAEQIAQDNADKQAKFENDRERAATRFNSYTRDKDMKPIIQTRRTARQVQGDIDAFPETGTPEELAVLKEELRQAKMLDGLVSPFGKKAKRTPKGKGDAAAVGTGEDAPAVSTKGAKGETVGAPEAAKGAAETPPPVEPPKADEIDPLESAATEISTEVTPRPLEADEIEMPVPPKQDPIDADFTMKDEEVPVPPKTEADPVVAATDPAVKDPEVAAAKGKPTLLGRLSPSVRWGGAIGLAGLAGTAGLNFLEQAGILPNGQEGGQAMGQDGMGGMGGMPEGRPEMTMEEEFASPYESHVQFNPMSSEDRMRILQKLNNHPVNMGVQTAQNWRN